VIVNIVDGPAVLSTQDQCYFKIYVDMRTLQDDRKLLSQAHLLDLIRLLCIEFIFVSFYLDHNFCGARLACSHFNCCSSRIVDLCLDQIPDDLAEAGARSFYLEGD
jgi:hypothetical protein